MPCPQDQVVTMLRMRMNNGSSFYRLIKPMGVFHRLLRRQDLTVAATSDELGPGLRNLDKAEPFSLLNPIFFPDVRGSWRNTSEPCYKILASGMILLKNYISLQGQADIVAKCQTLGADSGGFYQPKSRSGDKRRLHHMTCFGRNWDPVTRYENPYRNDGSEPPDVPLEFIHFAKVVIKDAQAHLDDDLPSMVPDVCVVNYYSSSSRLSLHQDRDESPNSLGSGLPVISVSVGDTAEFWYGYTRDENKLEKIFLDSGDVLVFGGKSRLIYHGVKKIYPMTVSLPVYFATRLRPCHRLNLTLRQF